MKTTHHIEFIQNEEGFNDGWYILETSNTSYHVVWQSDCFETKEEAEQLLKQLI